jgi:hypothetical protein
MKDKRNTTILQKRVRRARGLVRLWAEFVAGIRDAIAAYMQLFGKLWTLDQPGRSSRRKPAGRRHLFPRVDEPLAEEASPQQTQPAFEQEGEITATSFFPPAAKGTEVAQQEPPTSGHGLSSITVCES